MAFDPDIHEADPKTGFLIDKNTGHRLGLEQAPAPKSAEFGGDFPKWVKPHEGYVERKVVSGAPDHVSVPLWPEYHVDRVTGDVAVLVKDAEEEIKALSDPNAKHEESKEEHQEEKVD